MFLQTLLVWQFTFLGPPSSPYSRGAYTGRIHLPPDYPASPPSLYMLTPSGRWVPNKRICLSVTDFHEETWDVRWNVRAIAEGVRCQMVREEGEIGSCSASDAVRRLRAEESRRWGTEGVDHAALFRNVFEPGGGGGEGVGQAALRNLEEPGDTLKAPAGAAAMVRRAALRAILAAAIFRIVVRVGEMLKNNL